MRKSQTVVHHLIGDKSKPPMGACGCCPIMGLQQAWFVVKGEEATVVVFDGAFFRGYLMTREEARQEWRILHLQQGWLKPKILTGRAKERLEEYAATAVRARLSC